MANYLIDGYYFSLIYVIALHYFYILQKIGKKLR